jgi:hypothetical protein
MRNWQLLKFRLQIVASFGQLSRLEEGDEESDYGPIKEKKQVGRKWFIISKQHRIKMTWDMVSSVAVMCSFFLTLYTCAFLVEPQARNVNIEMTLNVFQLTDILLMMVTTRETNEGVEVDQFWLIAKAYLKDTFIFDTAGCLPGLVLLETEPMIYPLKLFRFIKLPRSLEQITYVINKLK